jgi:GxxExxY protein
MTSQRIFTFMLEDAPKALLLTLRNRINEVFTILGKGYSESVYQRALCVEIQQAHLPFDLEVTMGVPYKGHVVGQVRADIIIRGEHPVVIETKATGSALKVEERWQLSRYLKIQDIVFGILVNFPQNATATGAQIEFLIYMEDDIYIYNPDTNEGTKMV